MLSGNGRHRRPRQAPALLVAAGVTGSAIAIPLLAASGANAADGTTWDKVAECESGGSWSADTGNGYYGGLQLTQVEWEKYGGLTYASSPDRASRSQQIAVGEKILADEGSGAWPACGLLSGLTEDSGSVDVDTGVGKDSGSGSTDVSGSSGTSGSSGSSDSSADKSGSSDSSAGPSAKPSSSPTKTDDSAKSDTSSGSDAGGSQAPGGSASATPGEGDDSGNYQPAEGISALVDTGSLGTGRHRGGSAAEGSAADGATASSGRHAASGDGGTGAASDGSYTVRSGDTLCSIADSLGVDGGWRRLYAENKQVIGADPSHIMAGQTLAVGAETGEN